MTVAGRQSLILARRRPRLVRRLSVLRVWVLSQPPVSFWAMVCALEVGLLMFFVGVAASLGVFR